MERVQFQQEQMLAELKDLGEKGLFSQAEIQSIVKKRTAFESALVRRIPRKSDFLRYAAYEMTLEALRRRRVKRLDLDASAPSISDYALVRRQFHIFERALRKFKADVALWVQYIELARREGARALAGRISARALQLHPNEAALYVFAAQHEADNMSPAAARALLQRGIRLNKESVALWTEYVKFELGFVEGLRRRWDVLGVEADDDARREIIQGAIVTAVISEAAKANPQLPLFQSLHTLLSTHPSPLRASLLEHLHTLLVETLPNDPGALRLHAGRLLPSEPDTSEEFVDNLRAANEDLLVRARSCGGAVAAAYAEFVEVWCRRDIDMNLRTYLVACLQSLTDRDDAHARVLAVHVRLLSADARHLERAVRRARKYTRRAGAGRDADLWLVRLDAERRAGVGDGDLAQAWGEGRARVAGDPEGRVRVWMWGLQDDDTDTCEGLLRESIGDGNLHVALLIHYVTRMTATLTPAMREEKIRHLVSSFLGDVRFFRAAFEHEAGREDGAENVLEMLYSEWRRRDTEAGAGEGEGEGDLAWAGWLCTHGQGDRAAAIMANSGSTAREVWSRMQDKISTSDE